ncbi:MAG: hypothetical protein B5766_05460 [Candidatus Lumbricidophila eiseniae]|uniref:Uncharacterized protein n=1 Tax=Candidatus Lumbricidiphila eiseniae TaxID=1969409 RepID=A0A2A6FSV7_9MICO|nr:MAG: hypothetical protein B5766_05460 [Candidatus Lumbricidophila eiseniae]
MSRSDRDQAGGHPLRHPPLLNCLCCLALTARDREGPRTRQLREALDEQLTAYADDRGTRWDQIVDNLAGDDYGYGYGEHVYVAGRCIRCNVDWFDVGIYPGLEECPDKDNDELIVYSTSTDGVVFTSHKLAN